MEKRCVRIMSMFFICALLILGHSFTMAEEKVIEWKLQDTYQSNSLVARFLTQRFIEVAEAVSQGKLKITRYEPGAFVGPIEAMDGLSKGMYDVAGLYPGYYVGTIPLGFVEQGLPFGWTNQEVAWASYHTFGLRDLLREEYAKRNLFWLTGGTINDLYNIGSVKPIRKLSDAKGMKIRAIGVYGDYVKLLGATPVVIPSPEIYMALKLGTIEGVLGAAWYFETLKLGEVAHYYLLPNTNVIGYNFSVNMDSWNKLPEDLRHALDKALDSAFWESTIAYGAERIYIDEKLIVEKFNVEYTRLPKEEEEALIRKCQAQIWPEIGKKDAACAKGVEIVRKSREQLGMITAK